MTPARSSITGLKLNLRDALLEEIALTIRRFNDLLAFLRALGPDHVVREGRTVRVIFAEVLAPEERCLAGIRQRLRQDPALREELLTQMPELRTPLDAWDLPPDDCAALQSRPPVTATQAAPF